MKKVSIYKKKIMNFLKIIVFIFLIGLLAMVLHSKYIKRDPVIKVFGKAFLVVTTGSMEPTILPEEMIIISEAETYEKGDVVTYIDEEGFLITHRIIEMDTDIFISQGDDNNIKDETCKISRIQGKVIFHSKILGFFVLYLLKPICILYAISIVVMELLKQKTKGEKENENKTGVEETVKI